MKPKWIALAAALAAVVLARPLSAQVLGGRVLDRATTEPVKDVMVEVMNPAERVVARGRTDKDGFFVFELRDPGTYHLRASRVGYQTAVSPTQVTVEARQTVQVEIALSTGAVTLDPLRVTAKTQPPHSKQLENNGFYDRERLGFGKFMTSYEIMQKNPVYPVEVFRDVPGLQLLPTGGSHYNIALSRGGDNCSPEIRLDNTPVSSADLDDMIRPGDIDGVEVYRGASEIPVQFANTRTGCGLILIWTKQGEARNH
jgi:hypothetical protein